MKFTEYFKLKDVTIIPTNKCNLNCLYCFENDKNNDSLGCSQIKFIIDEVYENHVNNYGSDIPLMVSFFGGEPLLKWDTIECALKYSRESNYNIEFSATTNMTILTDEMIEIMDEYNFGLLISCDGIKEVHDRNRNGSFDIVEKNIKRLIDSGLRRLIEIRMTVMPQDLDNLLSGIKLIHNMGIENIAPVPVTDVEWTKEDILKFQQVLNNIWDWVIEVFNQEDYKNNLSIKLIEDFIENVLIDGLGIPLQGCMAGSRTSCSIGPNGDIMPCHQRHAILNNKDDLIIGNIFELESDMKDVPFNIGTTQEIKNEHCQDCLARFICNGGCPSENLTVNNSHLIMNYTQCLIYETQVAIAIKKLNELLHCPNIRNRRLNIIKENLGLLRFITEVINSSNDSNDFKMKALEFFEMVVDKQNILMDNYAKIIEQKIKEYINIFNVVK